MPNVTDAKIQKSFREWIDVEDWANPFAVTLTFKRKIKGYIGSTEVDIFLTEELASQNVRHFCNILNGKIFGNAAKRFGSKTLIVPVVEKTPTKKLHYHLAIDCPRDELVDEFPEMIREAWLSTQWGDVQMDVKSKINSGWIDYITKFRDKYSVADAIDWNNLHNKK